jgi:hypothetical protein
MDFKDIIKQLGERIVKIKDSILTEEATKNAAIMPFISALGYDIFNPLEVVPEFTCDIATKKGEKVDYAIMKNGSPAILIECKHWAQDLVLHDNQLIRYFNVSTTKFAILTNGICYKFYTETEPNKMDNKPFLEFDITNIKDAQIEELKKFHKSYFEEGAILNNAQELKYSNEIRAILQNELSTPSEEFVRFFTAKVYSGRITEKVVAQFTKIVEKTAKQLINDVITDRLSSALEKEKEAEKVNAEVLDDASRIVLTEEELESLYIVKSILRPYVEVGRITYKDTVYYFNIILDGSIKKVICRMYLNGTNKYIGLFDEAKKETKHPISNINGIYDHSDAIVKTLSYFIKKASDC